MASDAPMSEPLLERDSSEISELLTSALPHHPVTEWRLRRELFRHPGFDPELARVTRGAEGRIDSLAAAVTLPEKEGRRQAQFMVMATRQGLRRRGLAGALYAELETTLRRRGVQDIVLANGVVPSGLDLRYPAAATMLLRRRYVPVSVHCDQTLDPEASVPADGPVPEGLRVRLLTRDDASALAVFCDREFPTWRWTPNMIEAGPACGVFGAFDRTTGRIGAFAGYAEYVFGPTGTARTHRRRGLGTAVFWPAVRALRKAMPDVPILIGNANFMYYARAFGCHVRGAVWNMRKDLTADPAVSKGRSVPASGDL